MKSGLVSVSFRSLAANDVIDVAVRCQLAAIEWGGDVHVPHGDVEVARKVGEATRAVGLAVAAYGSYYRCNTDPEAEFRPVLESAVALGAPLIRVWAGRKASADATAEDRETVTAHLLAASRMAAEAGVEVALEYHANTLTDDLDSAVQLLRSVEAAGVKTLWQPPNGKPTEHALATLHSVLPWLRNVHVFSWNIDPENGSTIRFPLADHAERWREYLRIARAQGSQYALLEFIRNDSLEQLEKDAATLNALLAESASA